MDVSPRERLGYGGAATGLLAVPIMNYYPNLAIWIAIPMLILGIALLFVAILPMNIRGWRVFLYGFIPLHEAAKLAYEKLQYTTSARFAEHPYLSNADPIGWYITALLGSTLDESIQLFGCKPELDTLNPISYQEYKRHKIVVGNKGISLSEKINNRIVYDRLHINKGDLKKRIKIIASWDVKPIKLPDENVDTRMPLIELRDLAETKGWDFSETTKLNGLEFIKELRQVGLDGEISFWGRPRKYDFEDLNLDEPLHKIDSEHWKYFKISGLIHTIKEDIGSEENKYVKSHSFDRDKGREGFIDLHIERESSIAWLEKLTNKYNRD